MVSAKQIGSIAKKVIEKEYDYDHVGLRIQDDAYGAVVGQEIEHQSCHWDDGIKTDEEVGGICAVDAKLAAQRTLSFGYYSGDVILVIGSNQASWGDDPGEIILREKPIVLDIIYLSGSGER